ncbi:ketosteroid isomerase [Actinophytocola oryzae]|uniref:SnoaL-like protein n=1 Tax=Actinophytocola oryzae TaxID=502181 RepID=A0A4R7VRR1_9PSEU|nr:ketosteroid isomerase [Actinophytocola oryzae]TDV52049.1 hypothetical protein CLV71_105180 [Actinophytocola oryzae]
MITTRATVTEFLARLAAGEPDELAELFAERVDFRLDWPAGDHPSVPWIRTRSTRADMADHFRLLGEFHAPDTRAPVVPRVLVDGASRPADAAAVRSSVDSGPVLADAA